MTKKQRARHEAEQDQWIDRRRMLTHFDSERRSAPAHKKAARRRKQATQRRARKVSARRRQAAQRRARR